METTVTITAATRQRISELQQAMRAERNGRAVSVDEAVNRALDRSEEFGRLVMRLRIGPGKTETEET